ncbi:hypothetical protein GWK08_05995 [Leptobacterium flavescens]|uniref:RHS repeat-associated core domain-containing protein n=1 Tax=Leptobacterium flavescens TaxID=472055 RepID=A0A6P0UKA7_9FLAO|nr:RHS repeat-associated core domain-containing protein [Leptobacterium flavescens]NER12982.1 hypothetical protein [Leptobacterium flavescens]
MIKNKYFILVFSLLAFHGFAQQVGISDTDKNLISTTLYDINGTVRAASISYFNGLSKPTQAQNLDINTGKIWVSQILYDTQGRPALQTLSAPIGSPSNFLYKNNFVLKSNGVTYGTSDFEANIEDPAGVGNQANTLGWYYSTSNTGEPYQDITSYPFSRTIYDELNPGNTRMIIGGNKADTDADGQIDDWISGYSYTVPASQELYYAFGRDFFTEGEDEVLAQYTNATLTGLFNDINKNVVTLKAFKTISIDPHGVENVVFTDSEGRTLAAARSGEGAQKEVLSIIGDQGYVDIHIAKGCESGITYLGGTSNYKVYNLRTGQLVTTSTTLTAGVYRIEAINKSSSPPFAYIDKSNGSIQPAFSDLKGIRYKINYYDFSLNYYDEAGRLTSSLQPLGFDNSYTLNQAVPAHNNNLKSTYEYNALGQLIHTISPDEGEAWFKYRKDGQIRYSQNSKQLAANEFSYTNYDSFGRPVESGVLSNSGFTTADPDGVLSSGTRKEQHFTVYDVPDQSGLSTALGSLSSSYPTQNFVPGNVVKTYTLNPSTTTTWYSYDVYGRVEWMVQKIDGLGTKTIDYEYDPVTGSVTKVDFQRYTSSERFVHKYTYDAQDNNLIKVETSTDDTNYTVHADYTYYETGALKRMELGGGLQGVDYVYNLAGQLKSINHPSLSASNDPGGDNNDLFGMAIDYHNADYMRALSNITSTTYGTDRFDGNIKGTRWNNGYQPLSNAQNAYSYQYNRNNWLTGAEYGQYTGTTSNTNIPANITKNTVVSGTETYQASNSITLTPGFHATSGSDISIVVLDTDGFQENGNGDYNVSGITYDANGNIQTLNRNKNTENGSNAMDALSYTYKTDKPNQLLRVDDAVTATTNVDDIKDQDGNNYIYNELGQLITNNEEGISYIYNASGLVTEVKKNNLPLIKFFYNDKNHRVKKESYDTNGVLQNSIFYVRDAQGTTLAVYNGSAVTEHTIYGSNRLGMFFRQSNTSVYQLTDHLRNVRAVVGKTGNTATITNASDYYPFGMIMPNKQLNDGNYRYAYQGQEKDTETGKEAFELRLWDGRIGRWLTTDPYEQYNSPYLGMGNNPINGVDLDGGFWQELGNFILGRGWNSDAALEFEANGGSLGEWTGNRFSGYRNATSVVNGEVVGTTFDAVQDFNFDASLVTGFRITGGLQGGLDFFGVGLEANFFSTTLLEWNNNEFYNIFDNIEGGKNYLDSDRRYQALSFTYPIGVVVIPAGEVPIPIPIEVEHGFDITTKRGRITSINFHAQAQATSLLQIGFDKELYTDQAVRLYNKHGVSLGGKAGVGIEFFATGELSFNLPKF